jgi:hypothetical protein
MLYLKATQPDEPEPDDPPAPAGFVTVTGNGLRIRLTPEVTDKNIRGSLMTGDMLKKIGASGDFFEVVVYIHKDFVK